MPELLIPTRELKEALELYKKAVEARAAQTYKDSPGATPFVEILDGRKYWKIIITTWGSRSVHSFVDRFTGDVLMPARWSHPSKKPRGNIFDHDNGASALTDYGVRYLC